MKMIKPKFNINDIVYVGFLSEEYEDTGIDCPICSKQISIPTSRYGCNFECFYDESDYKCIRGMLKKKVAVPKLKQAKVTAIACDNIKKDVYKYYLDNDMSKSYQDIDLLIMQEDNNAY